MTTHYLPSPSSPYDASTYERVHAYLREHGTLRAARVSRAKARGAAAQYPYWGAVRYAFALTRDGRVTLAPRGRATSDRRSLRLAERDAIALAEREGRVYVGAHPVGTVRPGAPILDAAVAWIARREAALAGLARPVTEAQP